MLLTHPKFATALAVLRVAAKHVLDVVLGTVRHSLTMHADAPMTVLAADRGSLGDLADGPDDPLKLSRAIDHVRTVD